MPSIYELKPRFQKLLQPVLLQLHQWGITANQLTLVAIALSLLGGGMIVLAPDQPAWLAVIPLVLFVRMALNTLDGMMARQFPQFSLVGAV